MLNTSQGTGPDLHDVASPPDASRLLSLDVFRGIVMLILIPDTIGGFSFYVMAQNHPDHPVWTLLAGIFWHVKWLGMSVWDLIMPAFVFMAGVSIPYSCAARKARGESDGRILTHAAFRSAALLVLHLTLLVPVKSYLDFLWPLAVLAVGVQLPARTHVPARERPLVGSGGAEFIWWGVALSVAVLRVVTRFDDIPSFELFGILPSLGLAYFFAYLFVARPPRIQASAALGILFVYWLAFALYPGTTPATDAALPGITSPEETFCGFLSHWSKGAHVAAAFDVWFLNLFPRHYPYTPPAHGYHTLTFIPVVATLLFGMCVGTMLRSGRAREEIRNRLFLIAIVAVSAALALNQGIDPLVKRIWTSSWTLFSTGLVLILFIGLYNLIDIRGYRKWGTVFVVAGSNTLLLYVLAIGYRWPVLEVWRRIFGRSIFDGYWQPVAESIAFLLSVWLLALLLYRLRVFIRL